MAADLATDRISVLRQNLARVLDRIESARKACGRESAGPQLLAVTKKTDEETVLALHALGLREFGESRADELERKALALESRSLDLRWHFIGPLQKNKVRRVVRFADVIHSIDSKELLERVERIATEESRSPQLYLELKTSSEPEKHGFSAAEILSLCETDAAPKTTCRLIGMMTMAPRPDERAGTSAACQAARASFESCASLARVLESNPHTARAFENERCLLSMGMSGDLEVAVAAGSDLCRIGTALIERGAA